MSVLWVALGAGIAAPLRYVAGQRLDTAVPWGTLAVNTLASLVLGLAAGAALTGSAWALVATGFSGGLSTYSSFAVQVRDAGAARGATYAVLTIGLGLAAAAGGFAIAA